MDHDLSGPGLSGFSARRCIKPATGSSVSVSEPVRAGGTHGLGFAQKDGDGGLGAPGFREPGEPLGPIRCARACRMIRWIVNVTPKYSSRDAEPRPDWPALRSTM